MTTAFAEEVTKLAYEQSFQESREQSTISIITLSSISKIFSKVNYKLVCQMK
jgi:hypothetical protein